MTDAVVIIPTFNEIENIEAIIRAVFELEKPFHVLVVDDNSPDLTGLKVKSLQDEFEGRLFLETRHEKAGLGTAYIHGLNGALKDRMIIYLRWMPIFRITPKIWIAFTTLAM